MTGPSILYVAAEYRAAEVREKKHYAIFLRRRAAEGRNPPQPLQ
jgi:hypothetical protein